MIKNKIGEYIYINLDMYPKTVFFYKDSKLINSKPIEDLSMFLEGIYKSLKLKNDIHYDYILKNKDLILNIVIVEKGIESYTIKEKDNE